MIGDWKSHYARFRAGHEGWLHLCAHSHHYWPDVTREAQLEAWDDAARRSDRKWDRVLGELLPEVQRGIASRLGVPHSERITFASNTHELLVRLLSCFEGRPVRVLSTDGEFHSFRRQAARLAETGGIELVTVSQFPRESFATRFLAAAESRDFDVVFTNHAFFDSGGALPDADRLLAKLKSRAKMLVLDVYHSFLSRPFSLATLADDVFVVGGGYKYLQAGEGACFLYAPPKADALRPANTGWYAHFASLGARPATRTEYGDGAWRFWGSTFDPTALYRLRRTLAFLDEQGLTAERVHAHSIALQEASLARLRTLRATPDWLAPVVDAIPRIVAAPERGNFLGFPLAPGEARKVQAELEARRILCDSRENERGSFLRWGFGLYHDATDVADLERRLSV